MSAVLTPPKLQIGDKRNFRKSFSEEEVTLFARISTDNNPLHIDKSYAENSLFGAPIVHGMLVASLFSGIIGRDLPGPGAIYLGQSLKFKAPVYINEVVEASVEVVDIRDDKPIATLRTLCVKADGRVAIEGEAIIKFA